MQNKLTNTITINANKLFFLETFLNTSFATNAYLTIIFFHKFRSLEKLILSNYSVLNLHTKDNPHFFSLATAIELMILKNISSKIVQAQVGETVNLRCAATGMSNMKFSWSKDGRGLENALETYEGNQSTIVSVTIRNNKDFGRYNCTIKDGLSERNLTILVENWSEGNILHL